MVKKCKSIDTAAVLADLPERYSVSVPPVRPTIFTGAPFRLKTICRNGVPPRSGTTTALKILISPRKHGSIYLFRWHFQKIYISNQIKSHRQLLWGLMTDIACDAETLRKLAYDVICNNNISSSSCSRGYIRHEWRDRQRESTPVKRHAGTFSLDSERVPKRYTGVVLRFFLLVVLHIVLPNGAKQTQGSLNTPLSLPMCDRS